MLETASAIVGVFLLPVVVLIFSRLLKSDGRKEEAESLPRWLQRLPR